MLVTCCRGHFSRERVSSVLPDRIAEQRGSGRQHAPDDPKWQILSVGSQNATKPGADKTADLVEHKSRAQQQAHLLDAVQLADEVRGGRHGRVADQPEEHQEKVRRENGRLHQIKNKDRDRPQGIAGPHHPLALRFDAQEAADDGADHAEDAVDGEAQRRHTAGYAPVNQLRIQLGFDDRHKETACEESKGHLQKGQAPDSGRDLLQDRELFFLLFSEFFLRRLFLGVQPHANGSDAPRQYRIADHDQTESAAIHERLGHRSENGAADPAGTIDDSGYGGGPLCSKDRGDSAHDDPECQGAGAAAN